MNFNQLVPTSSSSNNKNSSRRKAIAWSPSCPSSLSLLTPITEKIQMAFSDGGLGCTQEEVSALLELMDARDVFESLLSENVIINPEEISKLASRYISILGNCIDEWNDRLDSSSTSDPEKEEVERQNLDALTNMNSIIHLSSICLLSPTFSIAAFVKYLRHHFVSNPLLTLFEGGDDSALEQMLNSPQPEYFRGGDLYWNLIKSFLERGLLEDAWNVISHHSLYKQSTQHAQDQAQHHITQEEQEEIALNRQGFECLYALLYSAPIPGGHSDDAVDDDNDKQEEEGELVEDVELLPGVPRNAHKFWNNSQTLPAAYSYFVKWNTHLQNFIRGGLPGHLQTRIPQLIPCVLMVLAGSSSSSSSSSINSAMKSKEQLQYKWAHTILYEIMYIRPDLNFYRVCERTNAAMSHEKSPWELMILSIMRGDAGEAVKATYSLGGGSSAALPSAVSALFCDLLTHANLLSFPKQSSPESKISNHHLELLLRAASSCISSFSTITPKSSKALMRYKNIGLQCAIRLLRYTHHFEGVSMMADFVSNSSLCYDAPDDYDVETILKLISSYPRRKPTENTLIYDAYTDICISRAQYYLQDARPGGAAYWYIKCIREFNLVRNSESNNSHSSSQAQQAGPSRATSLLSQLCHKTAMNILTLLSFLVDCYMEQSNKLAEQVTKSYLSYQDILTSNSNLKSLLECAEEIIVSVKEEASDVFEDNGTFSQNIELFFNGRKQSNQTTTVYSILFLHNMVQLAAYNTGKNHGIPVSFKNINRAYREHAQSDTSKSIK